MTNYMDADVYIYMCIHTDKSIHIQTHGIPHAQNIPSYRDYPLKTKGISYPYSELCLFSIELVSSLLPITTNYFFISWLVFTMLWKYTVMNAVYLVKKCTSFLSPTPCSSYFHLYFHLFTQPKYLESSPSLLYPCP